MIEPSGKDSTNPYEPPKTAAGQDAGGVAVELRAASGGARFANFIIDTVVIQVLTFVIAVAAAVGGVVLDGPITYVFTFGAVLIYYIGFELLGGRTVGKLITGTRVVNEQGGPPRLAQILGRTVARFVPFEPFSFLGDSSGGWHDRWSGTQVIKVR
jgi:uncharacterized RDD family membrane protein YckC